MRKGFCCFVVLILLFVLAAFTQGMKVQAIDNSDTDDINYVEDVNVETNIGVMPSMPQTVKAKLNDDSEKEFEVEWDDIDSSALAIPGMISVSGVIKDTSYQVTATVTIKSLDIVSIVPVTVKTYRKVAPELPEKIDVKLKDGTTMAADVIWSYIDPAKYAVQGSFEANGMILGTSIAIKANIVVSGNAPSNYTKPEQNTQKNTKYKIVIDPGHGGYDTGAIGSNGTREKDITLAVGLKLGKLLEKQNVQVVYTRKTDDVSWPSNELEDLQARSKISDDFKPDYYVSIHCNSFKSSSAYGTETYSYSYGGKAEKLARDVQSELVGTLGTYDRGMKLGNFYVIRETEAPAILTELAFISNPDEESLLNSDDFQNKCAEAIARAIMKNLKGE